VVLLMGRLQACLGVLTLVAPPAAAPAATPAAVGLQVLLQLSWQQLMPTV
jgi:hypothetical protein